MIGCKFIDNEEVNLMIQIIVLMLDVIIMKQENLQFSYIYGFIDFYLIMCEKGGIFMFYNVDGELLFVGKVRKLRLWIKKYFEDIVFLMKNYWEEVVIIEVCLVEDVVDCEIYEIYIINMMCVKYNVDKVFYN